MCVTFCVFVRRRRYADHAAFAFEFHLYEKSDPMKAGSDFALHLGLQPIE